MKIGYKDLINIEIKAKEYPKQQEVNSNKYNYISRLSKWILKYIKN